MKNFFIKEEFSFFVLLYTFIKKDTILTLIYDLMILQSCLFRFLAKLGQDTES